VVNDNFSISWAKDNPVIDKTRKEEIRIFTDNVDYYLKTSCSEKGIERNPPSTTPAIYLKILSKKIHKSIYWFEFKHLFL
jgi:hypothetical protein